MPPNNTTPPTYPHIETSNQLTNKSSNPLTNLLTNPLNVFVHLYSIVYTKIVVAATDF